MKLDYTEFVYFKKIFIFWNKKDDTAQQNLEQLLMQIQLGKQNKSLCLSVFYFLCPNVGFDMVI